MKQKPPNSVFGYAPIVDGWIVIKCIRSTPKLAAKEFDRNYPNVKELLKATFKKVSIQVIERKRK